MTPRSPPRLGSPTGYDPADEAHRLRVQIPADRVIAVVVPAEIPVGPAEIIVLSDASGAEERVALAGVLGVTELPIEGDPIADALADLRRDRATRADGLRVDR